MAARKRTFAEIIDLTADEDEAPVHKAGRFGDANPQRAEKYGTPQPLVMPPTPATNSRLDVQDRLNVLSNPKINLIAPNNLSKPTIGETIVNPCRDFKDIVKAVIHLNVL
jgi:hypothetical protein